MAGASGLLPSRLPFFTLTGALEALPEAFPVQQEARPPQHDPLHWRPLDFPPPAVPRLSDGPGSRLEWRDASKQHDPSNLSTCQPVPRCPHICFFFFPFHRLPIAAMSVCVCVCVPSLASKYRYRTSNQAGPEPSLRASDTGQRHGLARLGAASSCPTHTQSLPPPAAVPARKPSGSLGRAKWPTTPGHAGRRWRRAERRAAFFFFSLFLLGLETAVVVHVPSSTLDWTGLDWVAVRGQIARLAKRHCGPVAWVHTHSEPCSVGPLAAADLSSSPRLPD
ncbi:predicted protein [Plenodomus lingam JN3]|uniref:Predicted protein n=1 Tax=Leptosphaeria maculans (strain JN3 / isolate v23.1.3 / race Av1-4-5-6-7-8) TaxID=985895 RepID=E4ZUG9_LEPMJ|nr:predicted protein [Plenodomus lingam JN3]CBX95048.1 predicted protein [Plenodomus lingam JN3]